MKTASHGINSQTMFSSSFPYLLLIFSLIPTIQSRPATSDPSTVLRLLRSSSSSTTTPPFSVIDFGAIGDGLHYDTPHIQSAIDACYASGGGQVIFPPGNYLTATIYLRSRVNLIVQHGARVLGGPRLIDYPNDSNKWYVILAEDATDVGISGGGVIDGQGLKFVERFDERKNVMVSWNTTGACFGDECRPRLVGFLKCRNVHVSDVLLTEPAYWCLHIVGCQNTSIHDVSIYGDFNSPNNDGIDIEDSNNTAITRCNINTGDDAICPKTYTSPLHNLTATDCWIRTKSSAIKLGSASYFDFKDLVFDNITIVESHRGLGLQIRDGGNASDITFSNINISTRYYDPSWWGRAEPIYITTCPRDSNSKTGSISNLLFINITTSSENGAFLSGSKEGLLNNINFTNVNFTFKRWTNYVDGMIDYRPGCQGLVNHSMSGIYMEYIDGLVMKNVDMRWFDESFRGWNNPMEFKPSTVNNISFVDFSSGLFKYK